MKINNGEKTQKLGSAEYRFLCTAPFLNEVYHPIKFQVHSFYTLGEMARKKLSMKINNGR
jgi:hypothetical protein